MRIILLPGWVLLSSSLSFLCCSVLFTDSIVLKFTKIKWVGALTTNSIVWASKWKLFIYLLKKEKMPFLLLRAEQGCLESSKTDNCYLVIWRNTRLLANWSPEGEKGNVSFIHISFSLVHSCSFPLKVNWTLTPLIPSNHQGWLLNWPFTTFNFSGFNDGPNDSFNKNCFHVVKNVFWSHNQLILQDKERLEI